MKSERPAISSLENPLYYLENFRTVISWVGTHHADLLSPLETRELADFTRLSTSAQALLVRMVMRRGEQFRLSKLSYSELELDTFQAAGELIENGWLDPEPRLDLDTLFRLFTRPELLQMLAPQCERLKLPGSITKALLLEALRDSEADELTLQVWSPECREQVVATTRSELFQRVSLMFFGNLRQDWSEFVLEELGHQHYENVPFTPESRAFQAREEVDRYLHLAACREAIEAGVEVEEILALIPLEKWSNPWLEERRNRLLYTLGHQAERSGNPVFALQVYAQSSNAEALVRRLRVLERLEDYSQAWPLVVQGLKKPRNAAQQLALERIHRRLCRKLELPGPGAKPRLEIPIIDVSASPHPDLSVEQAAVLALTGPGKTSYYVENWLFNGLFALLCWPALYAPLRGAFFHPFHAGPVDLYRDGFVERRQTRFDECLGLLDDGCYQEVIRDTWHRKLGISSYFMHWELLNEEVLESALSCISPRHLELIFRHMLDDLRGSRSGMPDLVQFEPEAGNYMLIEVKGPGDRLQDNQRRWFEFFLANGIPASLCSLSWEPEA